MCAATAVSSLSLWLSTADCNTVAARRRRPAAAVCGRRCFAICCITMHRARARERVVASSGARRGPGATRGPKSTSSWSCVLFEPAASLFASLFPLGAIVPRESNSGEYTVRCEKLELRIDDPPRMSTSHHAFSGCNLSFTAPRCVCGAEAECFSAGTRGKLPLISTVGYLLVLIPGRTRP